MPDPDFNRDPDPVATSRDDEQLADDLAEWQVHNLLLRLRRDRRLTLRLPSRETARAWHPRNPYQAWRFASRYVRAIHRRIDVAYPDARYEFRYATGDEADYV